MFSFTARDFLPCTRRKINSSRMAQRKKVNYSQNYDYYLCWAGGHFLLVLPSFICGFVAVFPPSGIFPGTICRMILFRSTYFAVVGMVAVGGRRSTMAKFIVTCLGRGTHFQSSTSLKWHVSERLCVFFFIEPWLI